MASGAAILTLVAIPEGLVSSIARLADPTLLALVLFLGIPGGAVGFALWTMSLSRLTPTQVAVYLNVNPIVATALGAVLLSEPLTAGFLVGFALVGAGVLIVNRSRPTTASRRSRTHS